MNSDENSPESTEAQRKMEARLDYLRVEELIRETDVITVMHEALARWEDVFLRCLRTKDHARLLEQAKLNIEALLGTYGLGEVTVHPYIENGALLFGFVMPPLVNTIEGTWTVDL